jgi:hypothetical protein
MCGRDGVAEGGEEGDGAAGDQGALMAESGGSCGILARREADGARRGRAGDGRTVHHREMWTLTILT